MQVKVHMLAFYEEGDKIRLVDVPDNEVEGCATSDKALAIQDVLELVFKYGQNMFQPQQICSVSVGDVVELEGRYFLVRGCGFGELSEDELLRAKSMDRRERQIWVLEGYTR